MIDTTKPLFYRNTGRAATITEAVPVRRYHVQFSNGATAWMTEEELEQKFTNEPPRYQFATSALAKGRFTAQGKERCVTFQIRRSMVDSPAQDLNMDDVANLYGHLGRWLADRSGSEGPY